MTYHRLQAKPKTIIEGKRMSQSIVDDPLLRLRRSLRPNIRKQTHVERPWALLFCIVCSIIVSMLGLWAVYSAVRWGL